MSKLHTGVGAFATQALAKVMSDNMHDSLRLEIGPPAYDPHTNTLYLPGLPAGDIPETALRRLRAFLAHEAAERGFSTWMRDYLRMDPTGEKPGLKHLMNGINDARIDRLQAERYPGAGMNIRAAVQEDIDELLAANRKKPLRPSVNLVAVLARYVGEGLMTVDECYREFPQLKEHLDRVQHILRNLDLSSEERCIEQAVEMYRLLKGEINPPEQEPEFYAPGEKGQKGKPQQGDGQEGERQYEEQSGEGSAEGTGGERSEGDDAEGAEGDGSDEAEGSGDSDDAGEGSYGEGLGDGAGDFDDGLDEWGDDPDFLDDDDDGGAEGGTPSGRGSRDHQVDPYEGLDDEADTDHDSQKNLLDKIVEEMFGGQKFDLIPAPYDHSNPNAPKTYTFDPRWDTVRMAPEGANPPANSRLYAREIQVMETKLRQILTVPAPRTLRNRTRGRVDERALHRLCIGEANIFKRRIVQESDSVACVVSWDESASMSGRKITTVQNLAIIWNEALGKLGIPTGMFGWTTQASYSPVPNPSVYRRNKLRHTIYKEFDERWNDPRVRRRLSNITIGGYTPTGEGLLFAADRLSRRREKRRVLFFLTDGMPEMVVFGSPQIHLDFIQTVLRRCQQAGIEVVGVGIGVGLGHLFPHFIRVNDVSDLRKKASDELLKILREGRGKLVAA